MNLLTVIKVLYWTNRITPHHDIYSKVYTCIYKKNLLNLNNIFFISFFFSHSQKKTEFKKDIKEIAETSISYTSTKRKRDNPEQTRYLQVSFHTCMCMHVQLHRRPAVDSHYIIPDTTVLARAPI